MAPGRIYRDYSIPEEDKESFDLMMDERRAMQDAQTDGAPGSPQTAILQNGNGVHEVDSNTKYIGAGIAQTTDDATAYSANGDSSSSSEPVLHYEQMDDPRSSEQMDNHRFSGGAAPAPAIPWHMRERAFSPSGMSGGLSPRKAPESIASSDFPIQSPSIKSNSSKRMPEFFSQSTFQTVLNNPTISHQFQRFAQSRLCGENLDFLTKVTKYRGLLEDVSKSIYEIHKDFIAPSSATQINLPETEHRKVNSEMKAALATTLPSLESMFLDSQSHIEDLVYRDVYRKFVQYQMSISAAKALGRDRSKYAGLGDCFVLTDPSKADNPIVYASDGFVKVTGYSRPEIIPRNCRFLQSRETDRSAVKRLKISLDKREEHVELLLNRKKNGEPFWNLLYTTPLYDEHGKLLFFLGGQINCSTTIHNASDVLRILAQSNEPEEDDAALTRAMSPHAVKPSRSRTFMKSLNFRMGNRNSVQTRAPGMEDNLLNEMGEKTLKDQMSSFYTAYSNYIMINYTSFLITFVSAGILDLLFPIKARTAQQAQAIGSDIFKFLGNHGSGSVGSDFKSAVKGNLKMGQPISLDHKLCARPYMGFEKFVLHWTPLKDEHGAVQWVVLTLGNENRAGIFP